METFEDVSVAREEGQEKSGDTVNASSNVVQRLICYSFHRPALQAKTIVSLRLLNNNTRDKINKKNRVTLRYHTHTHTVSPSSIYIYI